MPPPTPTAAGSCSEPGERRQEAAGRRAPDLVPSSPVSNQEALSQLRTHVGRVAHPASCPPSGESALLEDAARPAPAGNSPGQVGIRPFFSITVSNI